MLETLSTHISSETRDHQRQSLLKINEEHPLFQGHFPGEPILPGVVLLQLFKEEAEKFYKQKLQLSEAKNVKFTALIKPGHNHPLQLISNFKKEEAQYTLSGKALVNNTIAAKVKLVFKNC